MSKLEVKVREIELPNIEWNPELSDQLGSYANVMQIIFNQNEFVLAFGQLVDIDMETGTQKCKLVSKVLVPHHLVPRILEVVEENLGKFTEVFGKPEQPRPVAKSKR